MSEEDTGAVTDPASADRAADMAVREGREDDRNETIDDSPAPDPETKTPGHADDPQAD